mmetsp:Transcript_6748/g.12459  ORF Transcript_6748/g.12459 Transcript_6748/m.12459 type:complete len:503 (+) Transcript_6748:60-1568(+)
MGGGESGGGALLASLGLGVVAACAFAAFRLTRGEKEESILDQLNALYDELPHVAEAKDVLGIELDEKRYVELMEKLIGEAKFVQNFPPELVPEEGRVIKHLLDILEPHSAKNGGPLEIEVVEYAKGRGNVIIKYKGTGPKTIGMIGSHLDVVPANPDTWERDPFKLFKEGDKLYGRGTTDCLGHVGLLTLFMESLAIKKPSLESSVIVVFIASEEATSAPGLGVDGLMANGKLEELKHGACLWIDASDSEPCCGTAGAIQWHLRAHGKRFHSGLPHMAINPIELANDALAQMQARFLKDFGPVPEEKRYSFMTPSTFKPTQISCSKGGLNQIPPMCTISGDIRLTPFYDAHKVIAALKQYVQELNNSKFSALKSRGPCSKYELPAEDLVGRLEIEFGHEMDGSELVEGVACDLKSPGFLALSDAIKRVRGSVKPYSICGSLPLVANMKREGFDIQIAGFGRSDAYHAENEYSLLSDMADAAKILSSFVSKVEAHHKSSGVKN